MKYGLDLEGDYRDEGRRDWGFVPLDKKAASTRMQDVITIKI